MLQILKNKGHISAFEFSYAFISIFLALSPIWIRWLISIQSLPEDNFGSGADAFVWFYNLLWAAGIYVILQLIVLLLPNKINKPFFLIVLILSIMVWIFPFILVGLRFN